MWFEKRIKVHSISYIQDGWKDRWIYGSLYGVMHKCHEIYDGRYMNGHSRWDANMSRELVKNGVVYISPRDCLVYIKI